MLRVLSNLFDSLSPARTPPGTADREHTLQLATAVLMVEVMRADGEVSEEEERSVMQALRSRFTLSDQELADLVELAHDKSENTHEPMAARTHTRSTCCAGRQTCCTCGMPMPLARSCARRPR